MNSEDEHRIACLEERLMRVSDELVQCQADKEFVWSLWKRLQVTNPDVTQAISLVVDREKHIAELKARKVMEILIFKDNLIQELEQKVSKRQQEDAIKPVQRRTVEEEESALLRKELTTLREQFANQNQELLKVSKEQQENAIKAVQRRAVEEEESALLRKELTTLREQFANQNQQLQKVSKGQQEDAIKAVQRTVAEEESALLRKELTTLREQLANQNQQLQKIKKKECRRKEEEQHQVAQALKEEKEGLLSRCVTLQADLEEKQRQVNVHKEQKDVAHARIKDLENELHKSRQQLSILQIDNQSLVAQLSAKAREVAAKETQYNQLSHNFAEVQTLYKQSTEYVAEQSQIITQLKGLNLDTQRVLKKEEEAHIASTTSYQQLYKELSQTVVSSEAKLRQSHQELSDQVAQKDHCISELQAQLQQQQELLQQHLQHSSGNRQTNVKVMGPEQANGTAQRSSSNSDQASAQSSDPRPEDMPLYQRSLGSVRKQQGAHVQRSRSLSPANSVGPGRGKGGGGAEQKLQDLKELLQLKIEENEELRKAHDRRCERLRLIQSRYKEVRGQLKEMEKSGGLGRTQRAASWQLRQENSDAVWNKLTYLKKLTMKLSVEKAGLEEELDILRVQAAKDRATVKEFHLCLAKEHEELLDKLVEERQVKSSTPKKTKWNQMEQSFKKIEQLELKILSLKEETNGLKKEKEKLLEATKDLAHSNHRLQVSIDHLQTQGAIREEAAYTQTVAQKENHHSEIVALETQLAEAKKATSKFHHQLMKLRQDVGILRAARDFHRNKAAGPAQAGGIANNVGSKVKIKTTRRRGVLRQQSYQRVSPNQAINWQGRGLSPSKDEWEDMSADSDSGEEYSDSLNNASARKVLHRQRISRKSHREVPAADSNRKQCYRLPQDDEQHDPWERGTVGEKRRWRTNMRLMKAQRCSSSSLQHRVESLQRHVDILQIARKDAMLSARELRRANEMMVAQMNSLNEHLCSSKQLTQKLTTELAGVEQQKKVLEMELEQWKQATMPLQPAPVPVNITCSCQGRSPASATPDSQAREADLKQLQAKLKNTSAEVTRQVAANKALRGQLQEKDDKLRHLQDKVSHTERDVTMKRQLVEDLKTRLKFLQDMEKSYRGQVEELEKKVKTLSEEASNRKVFIESLKRRLSVATTEKGQYEANCTKLKEDLEKKEQRVHTLQARVGASEQALSALEQTATEQMEGLTQQNSHALDKLQRQLSQAYSQLEQLHSFIKVMACEILLDIQEVKQQLKKRRRLRQANSEEAKGGLSAKSMIKAKSIAASILNLSESDLEDIMDTDQATSTYTETSRDQEWMDHIDRVLQQKIPSADQLMEALRVKMKERKVLTEELARLATPVSEKP